MDDKNLLTIFGLNLKYERLKRKLSQESVAGELNFSTDYVSNVESGKHGQISLINAVKFAKFYEKSLDYRLIEKS